MIVFVSYSSLNRERVEVLVLQLGALGYDVEYEVKIVGDPLSWRQALASIRSCDLFVSVLTPASLASYTCEIEYQYAQTLGKNILPVLMEDVAMMGNRLDSVVDFRVDTPESQNELARAIAAFPPSQPLPDSFPTSANWVAPLAELRQRIETLGIDGTEQQSVILNVREFLERRETFEIANSLLDLLVTNPNLDTDRQKDVQQIRDELQQGSVSNHAAQRQRIIAGAVALSLLVAVVAFILSQLFFRFRSERSAAVASTGTAESVAATQAIASLTPPTPTYTLTFTPSHTPTYTLTFTPSHTPTNISTNTAAPTLTATVLLATNTMMLSATSTLIPPTATQLPTLTLTSTPVSPTVALLLPTSTFTSTPVPPTNTPLPTLTFTPTFTVTPSRTPTPRLSFMPTNTPMSNLINTLPQSVYIGIEVEDTLSGLLVKSVGSTAKSAGVQEGDYVLAVDLDIVTTRSQFLEVMQSRNPFSRVTLRVRRGGGIQILTFVLGANDFTVVSPS